MNTTTETCHCGAQFGNSDHCFCCGCEQFERTCTRQCKDAASEDHTETCWES